jgi:transposase
MAIGRPKAPLCVSDEQRETLEGWSRRQKTANGLARRARMVLLSAEGLSNTAVAERVGVTPQTVGKWRARFIAHGVAGLLDEPRPGAPRTVSDADVERVIVATLEDAPADATHWSSRSMAAHTGLSATTIRRIWGAFGLQPHRHETWKLSRDPQFIEKVRDVVGLYLDPPERALVLCVDEKSQIQALDRSAPTLPMLPGTPARASHDNLRHGTTSLFAALDVGSGRVYGQLRRRHRAAEFGAFLRHLEAQVPPELGVHLILDNYATHKTPQIRRWLAAHPRFVLHFTPTSASWLNLVERWFAELTTKKLRRSAHRSTQALERDIREWLEHWNERPRPFVWTKSADEILASVAAYCTRISGAGR